MMSEKLWRDYLFLTKEMDKCLVREDFALFMDLLEQRQKLQTLIEEAADDFASTAAGHEFLQTIWQENNRVRLRLTAMYNRSKQQQIVSKAYDAYFAGTVGGWMDRKS